MSAEKLLARLVIASAAERENSFDHAAANAATIKAEAERQADPGNIYAGMVDYRKFYRYTLREACETVCPPEYLEPVFLLLWHSWNDALDWAEVHK